MITKAILIAWGLAASNLASGGVRHLSSSALEGMADAAIANPITDSDESILLTMGYEISIAWLEGSNRTDAIGDGGSSFCWGQVYLPGGAHTREGWSGPELAHDPKKCATVVVRLLKQSIVASPEDCPLCVYARGGAWRHDERRARNLSKHRADLAKKLVIEVPLPAQSGGV